MPSGAVEALAQSDELWGLGGAAVAADCGIEPCPGRGSLDVVHRCALLSDLQRGRDRAPDIERSRRFSGSLRGYASPPRAAPRHYPGGTRRSRFWDT